MQEVESQVRFPGVTSNPFFNFCPFCVDSNTSKRELWRREGWKMSALSASGLLARWWVFPPWVSETFHAQFPVSITDDTEASSRTREKKKPLVPKVVVVCTFDFLKSFNFCPGWLCHFKGLFTPVGREIHRSKLQRWRHDNRPIGEWGYQHDVTWEPRGIHPYLLFSAYIYNMLQIHSGETSRPSWLRRSLCRNLIEARFKKLREVDL